MNPDNLRYRIVSGRNRFNDTRVFHNRSFRFWKDFWEKIYKDQGSLDHFSPGDFIRQDSISVLYSDMEVVGCHGHTLIDLNSEADCHMPYLKFYEPEFLSKLRSETPKLFTFEYLALEPKWRKVRVGGASLAEVLIGLGCKLFHESGGDLGIATARRDVGVPQMAAHWGFYTLQENVMHRNFPCDIIGLTGDTLKDHPNPRVGACVESLWTNRLDQRPETATPSTTKPIRKKAA